jgi:hypothetical protein
MILIYVWIQSNSPLFNSQTNSHYAGQFVSWNDKVQIDYLVILVGPNW